MATRGNITSAEDFYGQRGAARPRQRFSKGSGLEMYIGIENEMKVFFGSSFFRD